MGITRGLTTPFLFSSLALDVNSSGVHCNAVMGHIECIWVIINVYVSLDLQHRLRVHMRCFVCKRRSPNLSLRVL
jgi:hypothetical protein